jgi:hypothetical protein
MHHLIFYLKHNVSETGFSLHLQVEPTQLGLKERALSKYGDRIKPLKHLVLNNIQNDGKYPELT